MDKPCLNNLPKVCLRFWGIRLAISLIILLLYLSIGRPLRIAVTEQVVYPQINNIQTDQSSFYTGMKGGALTVDYTFGDRQKALEYRPEFGFFFLISTIALLFVTDDPSHYWILVILHALASLLTYLFLLAGGSGISAGFILVDAIGGYLTPALSLALPLVVNNKINKNVVSTSGEETGHLC